MSTGLLYRAISLYCLQNKIDITKEENLKNVAKQIDLRLDYSKSKIDPIIVLNNQPYTEKDLHTKEIDDVVSKVSPCHDIREVARKVQWDLMKQTNCVIEGRDIGSVIASEENSKNCECNTTRFYMKADLEKCAERDVASGIFATVEEARQSQLQRNNDDKNRKESPLVVPKNAIIIDTSKYKDAMENTGGVLGSLATTLCTQVIQENSNLILVV